VGKKSRFIGVRLTEGEFGKLMKRSEDCDMSYGAYVRKLIVEDSECSKNAPKVLKRDKAANSKAIYFRLSDKEYQRLKSVSAVSGISSSSILRSIVQRTTPPKLLSVDDKHILIDLKRIGNNLNQIAAVANATKTIDELYLRENIADLEDVLSQLRQIYGV